MSPTSQKNMRVKIGKIITFKVKVEKQLVYLRKAKIAPTMMSGWNP